MDKDAAKAEACLRDAIELVACIEDKLKYMQNSYFDRMTKKEKEKVKHYELFEDMKHFDVNQVPVSLRMYVIADALNGMAVEAIEKLNVLNSSTDKDSK